ncbi:MAG: hypothetical protein U0414_41745 [Polyangiaceae bacterium]
MRRSPAILAALAASGLGCAPTAPPPAPPLASTSRSEAPRPSLPDGRIAARDVVMTPWSMCVLLVDATVWCLGAQYDRTDRGVVHQMPIPAVDALVSAQDRTFALTKSGDVIGWGAPAADSGVPTSMKLSDAREIAASADTLCARFETEVRCFGTRDGSVETKSITATAISIRPSERCAATSTDVVCWDPRPTDAAGAGREVKRSIPDVVALAASTTLGCALTREGRVRCWRSRDVQEMELFGERSFRAIRGNENGICALPLRGAPVCAREVVEDPEGDRVAPFDEVMHSRRGVGSIALSRVGACFVDAGVVSCWGDFDGAAEPSPVDLGDLSSLRAARDARPGDAHTCVLGLDDAVRCWGENRTGQLGTGDTNARRGPERVPAFGSVSKLAVGPFMTCVVTKARGDDVGGRVLCSGGFADHRRSADCYMATPNKKSDACALTPKVVTSGAVDVVLGDDFGCVLDEDGGVRCWGRNDLGQLGSGDTEASEAPRTVVDASGAPLRGVARLVASDLHACAIHTSGTISCWGYDDPGEQGRELGAPPALTVATPLDTPKRVSSLGSRCYVLEGGEARCWGEAPGGQVSPTPQRVGVCDARAALDERCFLVDRGLLCADRASAAETATYTGPPFVAASMTAGRFCGVDAEHGVTCRTISSPVPEIGRALPLVRASGDASCGSDPPVETPVALFSSVSVSARGARSRALDPAEAKILLDSAGAAAVGDCTEGQSVLDVDVSDVRGRSRVSLEIYGPPCEIMSVVTGSRRFVGLTPEARKLARELGTALKRPPAD